MKLNCVYAWSGVFILPIVEKRFLKQKQTEQNGDKHSWICPIETLVCNWWTNDYTTYQLDAGKSVQGGIECNCHIKCLDQCASTL
jgi:hypothetical protein